MAGRRIEATASRTVEITCGYRAASSMEDNLLYRTDDWVAKLLLPRKLQLLFRIPFSRTLMIRMLGPRGMYEWVIARTRYVDAVFARAATRGFTQVLLLGAGFDSRAIRSRIAKRFTRPLDIRRYCAGAKASWSASKVMACFSE